jgi:hypothetical protein
MLAAPRKPVKATCKAFGLRVKDATKPLTLSQHPTLILSKYSDIETVSIQLSLRLSRLPFQYAHTHPLVFYRHGFHAHRLNLTRFPRTVLVLYST